MGGACCKGAEPDLNPDGTAKDVPTPEQQARDPEQLRLAIKSMDAGGAEMLLRRMRRAAINSGATKAEVSEDQLGFTALHYAAQANWLTGCRLLVLYGATQRAVTVAGRKTPLHLAVEGGKRKVAAFLLELEEPAPPPPGPDGKAPRAPRPWRSANMEAKDSAGHTPLLAAFLTGRIHFTTWFVSACAVFERPLDYDLLDKDGEHAALCCARCGWWPLLKTRVLPGLKNGKQVLNARNKEGETVLGWLLRHLLTGELPRAEVEPLLTQLHGAGADVQVPAFKERLPPLCMAAAAGSGQLVERLIGMVPPPPEGKAPAPGPPAIVAARDAMGHTALHYAAASGHKDVCTLLTGKGLTVQTKDKGNATPSHLAAMRGHGALALELLAPLPEAERKLALAAVDSHGHHLGHLSLLSAKCEDDAQQSALQVLQQMEPQAAALPVQDKFKIGGKQDTPLLLAITGHMDVVVAALLAQGVSPNTPNGKHQLPLARNLESVTQATAARDARIFDLLIKAGAKVETPNPAAHPLLAVCRSCVDSFSAMAVQTLEDLSLGKLVVTPPAVPEEAGKKGRGSEVAPLLPRTPAPLDWAKVDEKGHGPMMIAAQSGSCYILKYLAAKFPELVNKQADTDGMSPLMHAASHAQVASMRVLLDLGADVLAVDKAGHDAMWHALRMDQPETLDCAAMLLYKGAKLVQGSGGGPDGKQPQEYLDVMGEGWLHRAVRYGATEFIRLWASLGGALHTQCTVLETANDLPSTYEVVEEELDFLDMPVEPPEEDEWEAEEVEAPTQPGDAGLRIDPNQQVATLHGKSGQAPQSVPKPKAKAGPGRSASPGNEVVTLGGPMAEGVVQMSEPSDDLTLLESRSPYMDLCPEVHMPAWRCNARNWLEAVCPPSLKPPEEDDPLNEEVQQLLRQLERQHAKPVAYSEHLGPLTMYDLQFHVHDQVILRAAGRGPVGEAELTAEQQDTLNDQQLSRKIEADMQYEQLLLGGHDPLSPHYLAARKQQLMAPLGTPSAHPCGPGTAWVAGEQLGSGPAAEWQLGGGMEAGGQLGGPVAEGLIKGGPKAEAAKEGDGKEGGKKVEAGGKKLEGTKAEVKRAARAAARAAKSLIFKKVDNRDPYFERVAPNDDDLYAVRKYQGVPQYIKQAVDMCQVLSDTDTMKKAEELHARLPQYSEREKCPDRGSMLVGPALRARNIRWWNLTLNPDEYPLEVGQWRRLDKKMTEAEAAARKRAPVADPKKIKPRKRTAMFGLPDLPSRPELLSTGAVAYAVRLCRPEVVAVLLQLAPGIINQMDGYGYTPLCYALRLLARERSNRSVAYMVDLLLAGLPDPNLVTRFKPVRDPGQRQEILAFVKRNMVKFKDCWADTKVVAKSGCGSAGMQPDEDEIIARLLRRIEPPGKGGVENSMTGKWRKQARAVLGLCRADVMEPLIACVAMADIPRLAWLVRKCGANLEGAFVYLPDVPVYYQGLLEKDVENLMSMCNPLHMAVAMRKFDLARWVVDLGADVNAVGSPRQDTPYNPWAYGIAFTKVLDSLKDDLKDEVTSRVDAAKRRKKTDKELLLSEKKARERFTETSCLTDGSIKVQYEEKGGCFSGTEKYEKAAKKIVAGSFLDGFFRLKRLVQSIEIPGVTRPHTWISPLHVAARTGQAQVAHLLLARGASPDGGPVRPYAKRTPLQESIMYARANYTEANWDCLRPNFEQVAECIDACIPGMNLRLQYQVAKEVFKSLDEMMKLCIGDSETIMRVSLRAFAKTVKFLVVKVLEMRKRPIAHWDPALATTHVLLLARAPLDPSETQSGILLRDIVDNGSYLWLGKELATSIDDKAWQFAARLYVFRMRESSHMGWGAMEETHSLAWYRWCKRTFAGRCDAAFFGAGAKAVCDAYNQLSEAALKKCAQAAVDRRAQVQERYKADMAAIAQARQALFKAACTTVVAARKQAVEQLQAPCVFDPANLRMDDAATAKQSTSSKQPAAGAAAAASGGWTKDATQGGGSTSQLNASKSLGRLNARPAFAPPAVTKLGGDVAGSLAKAASTAAAAAAKRLQAGLVKSLKQTAAEQAHMVLVSNLDVVAPPKVLPKPAALADSAPEVPDMTELMQASDAVSGALDKLGVSLGGFEVEIKVGEVELDGTSANVEGAVAAAGELVAGLQDIMDVLGIELPEM